MTESSDQTGPGRWACLIPAFPRTLAGQFLLGFVAVYLLVGFLTLSGYGMTWDESWENYYGDKTLNYYFSFNKDHLDFTKDTVAIHDDPLHPDVHFAVNLYKDNDLLVQPHLVWPVAPVLSSICKYVFFKYLPFLTVVDAHHVAPLLGGLALAVTLFLFLNTRFGFTTAAVGALALAAYPRWWAHCHFNPKDVLSTVFFSLTIFTFVRAIESRRLRWYFISAVLCGVAVACKANALFLPVIVIPYVVAMLVQRKRRAQPVFQWRESLVWAAYPPIVLTIALACWPLMWIDFPSGVITYWNSLVARGYSGAASWNVTPLKYAFATMPVVMIVLLGIGVACLFCRKESRLSPLTLLLLTWMTVPVLRVCIPGAKDFDGIRHWLEVLPPAAAIMGMGAACCVKQLRKVLTNRRVPTFGQQLAAVTFVTLCFLPQVGWMVANHPHQLTFFNPLVGRLSGARARGYPDATDYWGSSYRQGVEWLNGRAEEEPYVTLEVAEHLAFYYFDCIIEPGIIVRPLALLEMFRAAEPNRPYYLMTIVRPGWMKEASTKYHDRPVVHRITVDGADILQIRRIDGN